jgi:cyclopropane-fatty-acyl-phospholipid synthase
VTLTGTENVTAGHSETNQHYDDDPRIFALFLDPLRKYSAGKFLTPQDSLELAQQQKLRFVADRLRLQPGRRLLDIGCGWGSLVLFMAKEFGVRTVGISPAGKQHEYIAARRDELGLTDLISTRIGHIEDLDVERRGYDAVSMLGSIVHMPDLAAVFGKARAALKPGGMLYVSESCFRNAAKRQEFGELDSTTFVRDDIFGWGDMRPLSVLVAGAEDAGLSVVAVDDLTEDYYLTIEEWLKNVERNADEIDAVSPGMSAKLTRYLKTANAGWGFTTKHYALTCRNAR